MLSHFLHSLGIYTRRAIFPEMCKINQSSVDFHCKPFHWLIDWLIDWRSVNLDLIGLLDSYRTISFYEGGAKMIQHNGIIEWWQWPWLAVPMVSPPEPRMRTLRGLNAKTGHGTTGARHRVLIMLDNAELTPSAPCSRTASRNTSNSHSVSVGPAACSGWNWTL